jgi:hypothetical protein
MVCSHNRGERQEKAKARSRQTYAAEEEYEPEYQTQYTSTNPPRDYDESSGYNSNYQSHSQNVYTPSTGVGAGYRYPNSYDNVHDRPNNNPEEAPEDDEPVSSTGAEGDSKNNRPTSSLTDDDEDEPNGDYNPTLYRGDLPKPPYPIRNYRDHAFGYDNNPHVILGGWQNVDAEDVANVHQTLKNNPNSHNGKLFMYFLEKQIGLIS